MTSGPRKIVFVGQRGCGKSSIITCLSSLTWTSGGPKPEKPIEELEDLPLIIDPIFLDSHKDEEAIPILLIDTAMKDVMGTQDHIKEADLIAVVASIENENTLNNVLHYWLKNQLKNLHVEQPLCLIINKVDCVSPEEHGSIIAQWSELIDHRMWEKGFFVSSKTGSGMEEMFRWFTDILKDWEMYPRSVLYNRWEDRLSANFQVATTRVFRCLDGNNQGVLGFREMKLLHEDILKQDFTDKGFNHVLQKLNQKCDAYVTQQGLTLQGFLHLMLLKAQQRKWSDCWTVLRNFRYDDNLILKPRWTLPERGKNIAIELSHMAYRFLEDLFKTHYVVKQGIRVITDEAIMNVLDVLPDDERTALSWRLGTFFETDNHHSTPSLTLNGWLSFWANFASENPRQMLRYLNYLVDTREEEVTGDWIRVYRHGSTEYERKQSERNFFRALILSNKFAGKTTLCRQLVNSWNQVTWREHRENKMTEQMHWSRGKTTTGGMKAGFQIFCNRVRTLEGYYFLCVMEIDSNNQSIYKAFEELVPCCDLIVLAYDRSNWNSFKVMIQIFTELRAHTSNNLPVQVLALKGDLEPQIPGTFRGKNPVKDKLENLGLPPQEIIIASPDYINSSISMQELFRNLVMLCQNPKLGRVIPRRRFRPLTYMKRTANVTLILLVFYGLYRMYQQKATSKANDSVKNALPSVASVSKQASSVSNTDSHNTSKGKQL